MGSRPQTRMAPGTAHIAYRRGQLGMVSNKPLHGTTVRGLISTHFGLGAL
jgi:hypothetical protein